MDWKAGTAKAVITPENAVWLAGYGRKRIPEGVIHDLWLKVLALEDREGHRAVMVTTDLMGLPKVMYESLCAKLKSDHNLDRSQLIFTFSHNHNGPRLREDLVDYYPPEDEQTRLVEEYSDLVETRTVDAVAEALSELAPAILAMGAGQATFALNRRQFPGMDITQPLPTGALLRGPVDYSVPVLAVYREERKLEAVLFGYACHPTTIGPAVPEYTKWCGEYPGFAQREIERDHPGVTAMFINTCGGDQGPQPPWDLATCERNGRMLASAVEETLGQSLKPVTSGLRTAFEFVELDYLETVTREELQDGVRHSNALFARWAQRLLKKLDGGERFASSYPYPIQVWKLGEELLLIAMGGEAVVDYALRFRGEFGVGTWVCGYANDLVAYIPSQRVYSEGGYEGGAYLYEYGHPAVRWAPEVEDSVVQAVHRLVRRVS